MFWDIFVNLCINAGKSTTAVILELGLSRSSVTAWKKGTVPNNSSLVKIADYFNVPVNYLLGKEQKEIPSEKIPEGIDPSFYSKVATLNDDGKRQLRAYLEFLLSNHQENA